jgi:hypothetical protein
MRVLAEPCSLERDGLSNRLAGWFCYGSIFREREVSLALAEVVSSAVVFCRHGNFLGNIVE